MAADTGVVLRELLGIVPRLYAPSFVATLGDLFTSPVVALVAVQLSGRGPADEGDAGGGDSTPLYSLNPPSRDARGLRSSTEEPSKSVVPSNQVSSMVPSVLQ